MDTEEKAITKKRSGMVKDKKVEVPKIEQPAINLAAYASAVNLRWQIKSRLAHFIEVNQLPAERTVVQWDALTKKI